MRTTATPNAHDTTAERVLFMAFEMREKTWKPRLHHGAWSQAARAHGRSASSGATDTDRKNKSPFGTVLPAALPQRPPLAATPGPRRLRRPRARCGSPAGAARSQV